MISVTVPELGDASDVEVIELCVKPGDRVAVDDPLIVIESDKASLEVPAPQAGVVRALSVAIGDRCQEGDLIAELEAEDAALEEAPAAAVEKESAAAVEEEPAAVVEEAAATEAPVPAAPASTTASPRFSTSASNRPRQPASRPTLAAEVAAAKSRLLSSRLSTTVCSTCPGKFASSTSGASLPPSGGISSSAVTSS